MALLKSREALYLGPNWRVTVSRASGECYCIYDFPVVSFAISNCGNNIAFLIKDDTPPEEDFGKRSRRRKGGSSKPTTHTIKVFGFDQDEVEVGSLACTFPVGPARRIQWSPSDAFLFLYDTPSTHITILKIITGDSHELKKIAEDSALAPFFYQHGSAVNDEWCALINEKRQTADFWNLSANEIVATLQLSRRSIKLIDSATAGTVVISLYDSLCISCATWDAAAASFVKLPKIDGLFKEMATVVAESQKKISPKLRVSLIPNSSEFVVGLTTYRDVYRIAVKDSKIVVTGQTTIPQGASLVDVCGSQGIALVEFERFDFKTTDIEFAAQEMLPATESKPKKSKKKAQELEESDASNAMMLGTERTTGAKCDATNYSVTADTDQGTAGLQPYIKISMCLAAGLAALIIAKKFYQRN